MFLNFEKYYGLYKAFYFSVTCIKMTNEGTLPSEIVRTVLVIAIENHC